MITQIAIAKIRDFLIREVGISISDQKIPSLRLKLDKLIHAEDFTNIQELLESLESGEKTARELLIRYVTVNHTFFFREERQLDFIVEDIKKRSLMAPRIWCAASSTGEEVYSLMIKLLEANCRDFQFLASDLDKEVLHAMNRGVYQEQRLERLPKAYRLKYFKKGIKGSKGLYSIRPEFRRRIRIRRLNLMDNLHFENPFHYILCRNVLIYFNNQSRTRAIGMLHRNLDPQGLLLLGESETLLSTDFNVTQVGPSIYRFK